MCYPAYILGRRDDEDKQGFREDGPIRSRGWWRRLSMCHASGVDRFARMAAAARDFIRRVAAARELLRNCPARVRPQSSGT
jgi:hypothetical protein